MTTNTWLDLESLRVLCDRGTWERGTALYRGQRVLDMQIEPLGDRWQISGPVQGSQRQPYQVEVQLAILHKGLVASWRSQCSCPMGAQCKHGVALTLKAAYQGARWLETHGAGMARPAALAPENAAELQERMQARAGEVQRLEAEARLVNWLLEFDRASGRADDALADPKRQDQYLYLASVVGRSGRPPRLQLEAVLSTAKVAGGWAKPRKIRTAPIRGNATYDNATETDRQVLQLLWAMPRDYNYYYSSHSQPCVVLDGSLGVMALEQAASTGRLFADDDGGNIGAPLRWGPPRPLDWHWDEAADTRSGESGWVLGARLSSLAAPDTPGARPATLCLNNPPLYLDPAQGLCGPVQTDGLTAVQMQVLLNTPRLSTEILQKHQGDLLQRLAGLPMPPVVQSIPRFDGGTPRACLHLTPTPPADRAMMGLITAQLTFDYQGCRGWWGTGTAPVITDGPDASQGRVLLLRNASAEQHACHQLLGLGLEGSDEGRFCISGAALQSTWMEWFGQDFAELRAAGFDITLAPELDGWIRHADLLDVRLQAEGAAGGEGDEDGAATSPWFDLSLGMEIDGQRHNILPWLPELIAAAAAHPPDPVTGQPSLPPHIYLPAPGGHGYVRLPTEPLKPWMAALLELVGDRAHDFSGDSLRLSRLDALRASAALGEGAQWQGVQALRTMVQQLSGQTALPEVPVPASVQASLRPYQQQGLNWLQFLRTHGLAGILADDMGLGKTLQTLAHIQAEKDAGRLDRPALIIAPVSLMGNWQREAARFCPQLTSLVLHGKERHAVAESMATHDLVIAPYSLLQRDRERWLQAQWHIVVLDEAQNIKNASTHAAQVVYQLDTRHRLCLSGTPMENHLGEIWSLFHFLMPGFLGSQKRFGELFRAPIEKHADHERLTQLRARITPFMLRRTKALVAHELPPKVETVLRVELTGAQANLYETIRLGMEKTVREALSTKGLAKSQITILDALLKLRQVCCDPQLVPLEAAKKVKTSAKLEQLMELLPEMLAEGRRILLFSQFTSMLTRIETELKKRQLSWVKLTGQTQKRDAVIEQFTSGQAPLFLISLKAGGVGLNLPQADTVIHYDPWWNPAVEAQATDRAHRIGQTQSVWVLKLVAQGTIEERILALQERKAQLAGSIYSGAAGRKEPLFTEGDLAELLKPLSG